MGWVGSDLGRDFSDFSGLGWVGSTLLSVHYEQIVTQALANNMT